MSLQVWLPLNGDLENKGLADITIINNKATINNDGKIGKCYQFKNDNYLSTSYNFYNIKYSISIWIYSTSSSATQAIICNRSTTGSGFSIFLINGKLRIDSGGDNVQWFTNYTYPINTWFHLIITYDGTNVSYYINGDFKEKKTQIIDSNYWRNITSIGASQANGSNYGNYFFGKLNDIRIYDHKLSLKQIKEISKGLVLHYPLDNSGLGKNNLLLNTSFQSTYQVTSGWDIEKNGTLLATNWGGYNSGVSNPTTVYHAHLKKIDDQYVYEYIKTADETWLGCSQGGLQTKIIAGKTYTFSWQQYCESGNNYIRTGLYYYKQGESSANFHLGLYGTANERQIGKWQKFSRTFIAPDDCDYSKNMVWYIYGGYGGNGICYMRRPKLEENNVATPWSPNVNDTDYTILGYNDTAIYDCSGYQNNGILNNINYSNETVKYNSSVLFNGDTSYISVSSPILNNLFTGTINPFTFTFWVYHKDTTRAILFGDFGLTNAIGFNIELGTNHCLRFYWNGNPDYNAVNSSVKLNTWSFVSITYNGTQILFYINGKLTDSYTGTLSLKNKISGNFYLGRDGRTGNTALNGNLSDFRIYATALSAEDIKELYITSASADRDANFYTYQYNEIQYEKFFIKSNNIVNNYQIQQKFYDLGLITTTETVASFPDGADNIPMADVTVAIDPVQDLHGQSSPYPPGGGKNLLPLEATRIKAINTSGTWSGNTYTHNGITYTLLFDGDNNAIGISANGTATANVSILIWDKNTFGGKLLTEGSYILNGCPSGGSTTTYRIFSNGFNGWADTGSGGTLNVIDTYLQTNILITVYSGTTVNNIVFKPMIRLASVTDDTFVPYSNICPISGWNGANVSRVGKNLFNKTRFKFTTGYLDGNGVWQGGRDVFVYPDADINIYWNSLLIDVTDFEGETITYSGFVSQGGVLRGLVDENFSLLLNLGGSAVSGGTVNLASYPKAKYLSLGFLGSNHSHDSAQLELGSTATSYEPYTGNLYPITFPVEAGTVYGGTLDVTTGELVVDRAMVDLGTLDWYEITYNNIKHNVSYDLRGIIKPTISNAQKMNAVCSEYAICTRNDLYTGTSPVGIATDTSSNLWIVDPNFSTISLSGAQLVYELAEPITYQLTPQEIRSLLGQNNVFADTGDIKNLIYYKNSNFISIQRNGTIQANSFIEI